MNVLLCYEMGHKNGIGKMVGHCIAAMYDLKPSTLIAKQAELQALAHAQFPDIPMNDLVWKSVTRLDD